MFPHVNISFQKYASIYMRVFYYELNSMTL